MGIIAGEWTKLSSTRSPWWCALMALGAMSGISGLTALTGDGVIGARHVLNGAGLSLMIIMVMAAIAATADIQFGTARTTLMAAPKRWKSYGAKVGVVSGVSGLLGIVAVGLAIVAAMVTSPVDFDPTRLADVRATLGQGAVFALAAAIAVAVGTLTRRTGVAITILILWVQLIEPLAVQIPTWGERLMEWMPFLNSIMFTDPERFGVTIDVHQPGVALAYFATVAAALVIIAGIVQARRDA